MTNEKQLISVADCPCDGCRAKPCGHPARCVKFAGWLNKTADAVEVVHGRWERFFEDWRQQIEGDKCSACGFERYGTGIKHYRYCPSCGAKMDGNGNE